MSTKLPVSRNLDVQPSKVQWPNLDVQWITPKGLSMTLNIAEGTLANWRTNKKGPAFVRMGGLVRYHPEAVEAWLASQPTS